MHFKGRFSLGDPGNEFFFCLTSSEPELIRILLTLNQRNLFPAKFLSERRKVSREVSVRRRIIMVLVFLFFRNVTILHTSSTYSLFSKNSVIGDTSMHMRFIKLSNNFSSP